MSDAIKGVNLPYVKKTQNNAIVGVHFVRIFFQKTSLPIAGMKISEFSHNNLHSVHVM